MLGIMKKHDPRPAGNNDSTQFLLCWMDVAADPLLPSVNPQGPDGEDSRSESGGIEFHHITFWAWSKTGACEALAFPR